MDTDSVLSQIKFYHNSSNRIKNISTSNTTYWYFLISYALVWLQQKCGFYFKKQTS